MAAAFRVLLFLVLIFVTPACQGIMRSMKMIPMGSSEDIDYSKKLWRVLEAEKIVGPGASPATPFFGGAKPHGMILEILYRNIKVGKHRGFVVAKRNYDGKGVSVATVKANRAKYLKSITVMFQRENGYDPENQNWFWVKYKPNGTLYTKKTMLMEIALAGQIAKGKNEGCIHCHRSAGGGDYIFYPDISLPPK